MKSFQLPTSQYATIGRFPVIDQGQDYIVGYSEREDLVFQCPLGGVVVFGDHTCISKFVNFNFLVGADGTQVLAVNAGHLAKYFYFVLEWSPISSTGYNRHFSILRERSFLVPSIGEQSAILKILSEMDAEISVLEQTRKKSNFLKKGMMQELLTGRIRLV